MKFSTVGALCAAVSLCAPLALAKPRVLSASKTASNFSDATDGFSVFLPGKPKKTTSLRTFAGKKVGIHIVSATTPGFSYAVLTMRAPKGLKSLPPARQLDAAQQGFLLPATNAGFKLLRREDLLLGAISGRELLVVSAAKTSQMRTRIFFKNSVSYQIVAVGPATPSAVQKAQVTRVLDSLRIQGAQ